MPDYKLYHKRNLPHIQPKNAILFVTIRTSDPIPEKFMNSYYSYLESLKLCEEANPSNKQRVHDNNKRAFAFMDNVFSLCEGEISLTYPESVGKKISDILHGMDDTAFRLYAYTIMPNHIHILFKPLERDGVPIGIAEIMQRIKGLTSREVNVILKRSGALWYREYYDHWVRNSNELVNIVEYIRQNPVKAGLVQRPEDWQWTYVDYAAVNK